MMNEFVWKKQEAIAEIGGLPEDIRKVLVIYTGGTIGMKFTSEYGKSVAAHRSGSKLKANLIVSDVIALI